MPETEKHSLAGYLAGEVVGHIAGPWTKSVANEIVNRIPAVVLPQTDVRTIVSGTISGVMGEGFSGLASWGMSGL